MKVVNMLLLLLLLVLGLGRRRRRQTALALEDGKEEEDGAEDDDEEEAEAGGGGSGMTSGQSPASSSSDHHRRPAGVQLADGGLLILPVRTVLILEKDRFNFFSNIFIIIAYLLPIAELIRRQAVAAVAAELVGAAQLIDAPKAVLRFFLAKRRRY